jgi:hypothetical protein
MRQVVLLLCLQNLSGANLPVRTMVLFKHGIGFFERSGSIPAGETARLEFKASEMKDVLKSLLIGGRNERSPGSDMTPAFRSNRSLASFHFESTAASP